MAVLGILLLGLIGCAVAPEKAVLTHVEVAPPVKIPVPVLCVRPEQLPAIAKTSCTAGMSDEQKARCLDIDIRELQNYAVRSEALLAGCTQALPKEAPK